MVGHSIEVERLFRRFRVGTRVVATCPIFYGDSGVQVDAGDEGVVVAPELVEPIVRVVWDDHPARSFTTNVANLDLSAASEPSEQLGLQVTAKKKSVRERDRAKASGEQVCRVCVFTKCGRPVPPIGKGWTSTKLPPNVDVCRRWQRAP